MAQVTDELQALNQTEGPPLDQLKKVLDIFQANYIIPQVEKDDTVVRHINGTRLHLFLEPNSVVFFQRLGPLVYLTMIEQLSKVKCVAFRTQIGCDKVIQGTTDLINYPGTMGSKFAGRILIRAKGRSLYMLFESRPGNEVGQCSTSVDIDDCLREESPMEQTVDIHFSYQGDHPYAMNLVGKISTWKF